ncbi:MAG: hypothetical protein L6W00_02515 [Lentisphaeria bacterium]|nr:MAG: hypothetical protein L6W00_02515 [Lentisphaeria bacterium]
MKLLEEQASPERFGEALWRIFQAQKSFDEKVDFLYGFQWSRANYDINPVFVGRLQLKQKLSEALEKSPDSAELHFFLALTLQPHEYVCSENPLGHLRKARKLAPGNPRIEYELGRMLLRIGDFQEAEPLLTRNAAAVSLSDGAERSGHTLSHHRPEGEGAGTLPAGSASGRSRRSGSSPTSIFSTASANRRRRRSCSRGTAPGSPRNRSGI